MTIQTLRTTSDLSSLLPLRSFHCRNKHRVVTAIPSPAPSFSRLSIRCSVSFRPCIDIHKLQYAVKWSPNPTLPPILFVALIEVDRKQVDAELVKRVLSTNICVDQRGEPRSAPLLLRYEPQVRSFLESLTIPRSQAVEVQPNVIYVAQLAEVEQPQDHPDLIPLGQVCEMAPQINPFKLMGKTADASSFEKAKGKWKGRTKGTGAGKKLKKPTIDATAPEIPVPTPS
uniref:Uncharacterized protein n=1 Tax=Fagus sylvatica TaxID=28930 RepID=A0A2N9FJH0_FAGSY